MTPSKEDYIKLIVELGDNNRIVANKEIAEAMDVKAASVTDMIIKLVEDGLVDYEPYKGVRATHKGHALASKLIRKHRIWEVFLFENLGYSWDEVHDEADVLEHASSDKLIERLYNYLGQPTHDPHGGVIPEEGGLIDRSDYTRLADLKEPIRFKFIETSDEPELLKYIDNKNFKLNQDYLFIDRDPYDGQFLLQNQSGEQISLSPGAANNIYIEKLAQDDDQ